MQHLLNESNRIPWVDYLKGLSIFLVVLGHSYVPHTGVGAVGWAFSSIYAFHMPLFFVLAGITAAVSLLSKGDIGQFLKLRFMTIFIPYLCWSFLRPLFFADMQQISAYSFEAQWMSFVTGDVNLWFLPALLLLQVYYCIFYVATKLFKQPMLQCLALGIIFAIAVLSHKLFGKTSAESTDALQWLTSAYTYFIPFFFGVFLVHYKKVYLMAAENRYVIALALVYLFGFTFLMNSFPYQQYSKVFCGVCAAVVLMRLFLQWKQGVLIKGQLQFIGQYTLIIYIASGFFESRELNLLLEGMNATFVQVTYGVASLIVCYICILFSKFIELSDILSFLLLGKLKKKPAATIST